KKWSSNETLFIKFSNQTALSSNNSSITKLKITKNNQITLRSVPVLQHSDIYLF
ncbi:hypothetical protein M153_116280002, partial [Pseudoloma neurophilia]